MSAPRVRWPRLPLPPSAGNLARWQELAPLASNLNQIARACNAGLLPEGIYPAVSGLTEQVRLLRLELLGIRGERT